jgi:hypothetical protein
MLLVNRQVPAIGYEGSPKFPFILAINVMVVKLLDGLNEGKEERRLDFIGQVRKRGFQFHEVDVSAVVAQS